MEKAIAILTMQLDPESRHFQTLLRAQTALVSTALTAQVKLDEVRLQSNRREDKALDLEVSIVNLTKLYFSTFIMAIATKQLSAAKSCLDSVAKLHGLMGQKDPPDSGTPQEISVTRRNASVFPKPPGAQFFASRHAWG